MKKTNFLQFWDVITPIFYYFIVTSLTLVVLNFLPLTEPFGDIGVLYTPLFRQLISSIVVGIFLWSFYKPEVVYDKKAEGKILFVTVLMSILIGGCFAIAFNNILGMLKIEQYSDSYAQVEETFYTGKMALELVALCIVIPFVEELLYRGIVYGRLKKWLSVKWAIVISAIIFGAVHMNLVQFIYAAVFGLILGFVTEKSGTFYMAALAHMVANFTSVLRAETNALDFISANMFVTWFVTVVLLAVTVVCLAWYRCRE